MLGLSSAKQKQEKEIGLQEAGIIKRPRREGRRMGNTSRSSIAYAFHRQTRPSTAVDGKPKAKKLSAGAGKRLTVKLARLYPRNRKRQTRLERSDGKQGLFLVVKD